MAIKTEKLSFATTGLLLTAIATRNIAVPIRVLDSFWETNNTTGTVLGNLEGSGLLRCIFSNGDTDVRRAEQITEPRVWTAPELEEWLSQHFSYNGFNVVQVGQAWTITIGGAGGPYVGTDNNKAEAIAKAMIAYLNGTGVAQRQS
jgi:hypothetical protein